MVLIDSDLVVRRFDYRTAADGSATLRLVAALTRPPERPLGSHLVLDDGDLFIAPTFEGSVDPLLSGAEPRDDAVVWHMTFVAPGELVASPGVAFSLLAPGGMWLHLPAPMASHDSAAVLAAAPRAPKLLPAAGRQLAVAATLAAMVGTAGPAVAQANTTGSSQNAASATTSGPGHALRSLHRARHDRSGSTRIGIAPASGAGATTATTGRPGVRVPSGPPPEATIRPPDCVSPTAGSQVQFTAKPIVSNGMGRTLGPKEPGCSHTRMAGLAARGAHGAAAHARKASGHGQHGLGHSEQPAGHHGLRAVHRHGDATGTARQNKPHGLRPGHRTSGGGGSHPGPAPHHSAPTTPPRAGSSTPVGRLSPTPPYENPSSWTGTVAPNPSLTGLVHQLNGLLSNGDRPPSFLIPIYMQAGRRYDVPWEVLAAINAIESDYGNNLSTSSAGAIGWMQFEPSTWKEWGVAMDGHSMPNPYDPRDAIFSAARYLQAAGAAHDLRTAIFAYNHADWYVQDVLARARAIATHAQYLSAGLTRHGTFSVDFATGLRRHPTVFYTGGVLSHYDRLIAAANMVSAANFPYLYGGGHTQPARWGPFDCSGSVSYVMQQAGYNVPTTVSGDIPSWGFPAGPGQVTIFYNPVHTFMRIGDRYFGTSGFARPSGGAGWFDVARLPASYLSTFREVHVPGLGPDSFSSTVPYVWPAPRRTARWWDPMHAPRLVFERGQI